MLTLNTILKHEGVDPKNVRLVRHQVGDAVTNCTPYDLWRAGDGRLETYQRIRKKEKFAVGDYLASFVVTPSGDTLFVGFFHVTGLGIAPQGTIDPVLGEDRTGLHLYEIQRDERLSEYVGHLVIEWGKGYIQWAQNAESNDKSVLEIRKEVKDEAFPGFTRFYCDIDQIETIPLSWQEVLKHVRGVYLLVCKETGKQYVGSAKGDESLWGRFCGYKRTGHGGNVELKRLGLKKFQATVLEVVNSDTQEIEQIETAWKKKLLSREFGLNKN
jgi:GIY-YIG catalytic domain